MFLKKKRGVWTPCWARAAARQSARDASLVCRAAVRTNTHINQSNTDMLRTACSSAGGALGSPRQDRETTPSPQARQAVRWPHWYLHTNAINYESQVHIRQRGRRCAGPTTLAGSSSGEHNARPLRPRGCFKLRGGCARRRQARHAATHIHTYIHTYKLTNMHTNIHTYTCMHTYTTQIHTYIHTYIHAYMHTCIHTCIHAYIHTYMHAYKPLPS